MVIGIPWKAQAVGTGVFKHDLFAYKILQSGFKFDAVVRLCLCRLAAH